MNTRLLIFMILLFGLLLLEFLFPRRKTSWSKWERYPGNLSLAVISQIVMKFAFFSVTTISIAAWVEEKGIGLFNLFDLPTYLEVLLTIFCMDLLIYWQHRLFHRINFFWRLHRVHHTDSHLDVTSALRFHPLEIILSFMIKLFFIGILGISPLGILIFEATLNGTAMFNHANLKLPGWLDNLLRLFIVTPDMHRVHHSNQSFQMNSNFGFNLPWWDRLFGSYEEISFNEQTGLKLGCLDCSKKNEQGMINLLLQPFKKG